MNRHSEFNQDLKKLKGIIFSMCLILASVGIVTLVYMASPSLFHTSKVTAYTPIIEEDEDKIENGIHLRTGLVDDTGLMTVVNNCTNCHSAKLVTQNRMSEERWLSTIKWMQKTQNLWDLGANEAIIVKYLAKNYAPTQKGRRENLTDIDWYELKE